MPQQMKELYRLTNGGYGEKWSTFIRIDRHKLSHYEPMNRFRRALKMISFRDYVTVCGSGKRLPRNTTHSVEDPSEVLLVLNALARKNIEIITVRMLIFLPRSW